jgi:U3 small nucleolar RNA-associated protein 14
VISLKDLLGWGERTSAGHQHQKKKKKKVVTVQTPRANSA